MTTCASTQTKPDHQLRSEQLRDRLRAVFLFAVPELTGSFDIKLNQRLMLQGNSDRLLINVPDNFPMRPGPHQRSRQAIILRLAALFIARQRSKSEPLSGIATLISGYEIIRTHWTPEEDFKLVILTARKIPLARICRLLARKPQAIWDRRRLLDMRLQRQKLLRSSAKVAANAR